MLAAVLVFLSLCAPLRSDPVRFAVFNVEMQRDGPGLLLRDILTDKDRQVELTTRIIQTVRPDVLLLLGFDHDVGLDGLSAFRDRLAQGGKGPSISYPFMYSPPQNSGVDSGYDLNGDGLLRGPADAFGYGAFRGQGGMAILSRYPVTSARDFSQVLWRELPDADLPKNADGTAFPSKSAQAAMRLSSHGHWDVTVDPGDGRAVHLLASYSSPPVFDGPEDMNGKRNHDELRFWDKYLSGHAFRDTDGLEAEFSGGPYVVMAGLNADPSDGEGAGDLLRDMILRGQFQDAEPESRGAVDAAADQGGANARHRGNPALDTADWRDDPLPGNLRVDYVLPSVELTVTGSGVFWPTRQDAMYDAVVEAQTLGTRHRLVWVDIE